MGFNSAFKELSCWSPLWTDKMFIKKKLKSRSLQNHTKLRPRQKEKSQGGYTP